VKGAKGKGHEHRTHIRKQGVVFFFPFSFFFPPFFFPLSSLYLSIGFLRHNLSLMQRYENVVVRGWYSFSFFFFFLSPHADAFLAAARAKRS